MLTLFHGPGSCSLACWIALEESGLPYRIEIAGTRNGDTRTPAHLARNPWGRVPVLDLGTSVLTENIAIQTFVADMVLEKQLLPPAGTIARAEAMAWLGLLSSTVHVAFRPIFRSERLALTKAGQEDVAITGRRKLDEIFAKLEDLLGNRPWVTGDRFTLCDSYLAVYVGWLERPAVAAPPGSFARLRRHAASIWQRPAARRVAERELALMRENE